MKVKINRIKVRVSGSLSVTPQVFAHQIANAIAQETQSLPASNTKQVNVQIKHQQKDLAGAAGTAVGQALRRKAGQ